MNTQTSPRYLSAAETAKLVRQALKREFADTKFSVRSSTYSGGASIDVSWTDGPRTSRVEAVAKEYQGGRFDGMIDYQYRVEHWLRPDGRVMLRRDPGTSGQRGSNPGTDNRNLDSLMLDTDAERVRFGADFIFCTRHLSNESEQIREATDWLFANCEIDGEREHPEHARFGNDWVTNLARNMAYYREAHGTWPEAFEARYA